MKNQKLRGIMPALLTAFDEQGINGKKVKQLVHYLLNQGVNGIYVGGSSGEMLLCSLEERKQLLESVLEEVNGRTTVIAHIGCMSTKDSLALARHAEQSGADAISSVTPLYYKYSFSEVKAYYERIADHCSLPLIIYNIPALTGTTLNEAQLHELLQIPRVAGMKYTASDFFLLERLRAEHPSHVFLNGCDEMLLSGLAAGADGGIGTTYNFMPDRFLLIYQLFCQNQLQQALAVQSEVNRYIKSILQAGVIPACKEVLRQGGLDYGICREPFLPLSEQNAVMLNEAISKHLNHRYLEASEAL